MAQEETTTQPEKKIKSGNIVSFFQGLIIVLFMSLPFLALYDHFLESVSHPYGSWGIDIPNVLIQTIGYDNLIGRLLLIALLTSIGVGLGVYYLLSINKQK